MLRLIADFSARSVVGDKAGHKIDHAFLSGMKEASYQRTMIIRKPAATT